MILKETRVYVYFKNLFCDFYFIQNEDGYFVVPYDAELECKQNIVVYDSNTSTLREPEGKFCIRNVMANQSWFRPEGLGTFWVQNVYTISCMVS